MLRMQWKYQYFCLSGLFIILWIVSTCLLSSLTVYAGTMPGGNIADPAVRTVDVAAPAVVRMITTIKAHLTVNFPPTTQITFPQQDNGSYPLQMSGTGTFITSQGDILTFDHVVNPPKDKTLDQLLYSAAAQDIANYLNQNAKQSSSQETKDDVIQQLTNGQLSSTTSYAAPSSIAYLSTGYIGPLTAPDLKSLLTGVSWQVDQIKKELSDQQDLAIVHVPMQDAPSVQLGDSSKMQDQGSFTVIGFPSNVDVSQPPNDFLTSSVTMIAAGSKQTSAPPTSLNQGDGNSNGGGLVVDSQGMIVGLISSNDIASTSTFLQDNNNERAMLHSLNLSTASGPFQQAWSQAFQDYASTAPSHWQKALDDFKQLAVNYPNFKAAQPYLNTTQGQVERDLATSTATAKLATTTAQQRRSAAHAASKVGPASLLSAQALTVAAIVFLLLLVVLLFAVIVRQTKKRNRAKIVEQTTDIPHRIITTEGARNDASESGANAEPVQVQPDSPQPSSSVETSSQNTLVLKIWPCGHMNRPSARFCSICGEAAPTLP